MDAVHLLILEGPFNRVAMINSMPEEEIKSGGWLVSSMEAVIWCSLTTDSFKDSLIKEIHLDNDTDTTAYFAVGLAAACCYESEDIPSQWVDAIPQKKLIADCLS